GPRLLQLDAPHAEVGLGARPEPGGPVRAVELEDDPLALPQRPEDRPLEGAGGQGVLRPVGVADDGALARPGVVGLDHALHRGTLRLPAYHAAVSPSRYAGGLAERRIRVPGAAAPGAAGTDVLTEGVHFDLRWTTPADVGWKALAVNLSDIAAMGGAPRAAVCGVVLGA